MDLMEIINAWPKGCRAAVSLTYDDGIPNHYQLVAPALEEAGLRGTFYTPVKSDLMQHPLTWRGMAKRGHELGNHGVFHPCWSPGGKYNDWLEEEFNLVHYDEARWLDEMDVANNVLRLVDGREERSFGNTCFDNYLGLPESPQCLEPLIERLFDAARGEETGRPVDLAQINWNNLGTVWADRRSAEEFSVEMEEIIDTGGWVIYTFHGVGEDAHNLHIAVDEHEKLLHFLHQQSDRIWTAPLIEVVRHLRTR